MLLRTNIHVLIEHIGDLAIIELLGPAVFMRLIMFNRINILTRSRVDKEAM